MKNSVRIAGVFVGAIATLSLVAEETRQATGVKVGEVTDTTAIVWTRLTAAATRNNRGMVISGRVGKNKEAVKVTVPVEELEGACPGADGRVRVRYGTQSDLVDARSTDWVEVSAANDFIQQFQLKGLRAATVYHYVTETTGPGGTPVHAPFRGKFTTAPAPNSSAEVLFCVMTCQGYPDRGHPDGHPIYPSMQQLAPQFISMTGDLVYYDSNEPRASTPRLARYHWERMFSLPRIVELTRNVSTYWLKDDHDTVDDDSWPGRKLGELTFEEGQRIFRQQTPLGERSYRTFRWGKDLQIWLTDGRDFRSPNRMPDGPDKTIWGSEQKEWLKRTLQESDATWKILISPTPIVGPDRVAKNDNHANIGFQHEGDEIREWFQANVPDNFFVLCGDRHWQYHSVHPQTALNEFSVGPASDEHAGGTPGLDPNYHRFHRVKGGFLSVRVSGKTITLQHRDVLGEVVYEFKKTASSE